MKTILLVDDDATINMFFEEFLPSLGYKVLGEAQTGKESIQLAIKLHPDIVLMDIRMPGKIDGIQAAATIKAESQSEIIFVSGHTDEVLLDRARILEPLGFIFKPFSEEQVAATLKIAFYQIYRSKTFNGSSNKSLSFYENLSPAERQIALLLKKGKATNEIAQVLNVSPATVIWHRKNIRKKLGIAGSNQDLRKTLSV
jgi:DNA-binding NarL/FixJ family response regulator